MARRKPSSTCRASSTRRNPPYRACRAVGIAFTNLRRDTIIDKIGGSLRSPAALVQAGLLQPGLHDKAIAVADRYPIAVTPHIAGLIDPNDAEDPIARQFIPDLRELSSTATELADPIGDHRFQTVKGIIHRYPDRVLIKPIHACPVYCRFCFRREMVGPGGDALSRTELEECFAYVARTPAVSEVIITGGDPLLLPQERLRFIIDSICRIPHVAICRIHTRVPIVDPSRITPELVQAMDTDKALFVVIHANHVRELTPQAAAVCRLMSRAGIPLLSQSVLLQGVNDDADSLEALFRGLVAMRIKPYYLHHPDLAPGTSHFRVSIEHGQKLMRILRGRLSGLAQPQYVLDVPGGHGKIPIGPCYIEKADANGIWKVEDYCGRTHIYSPESPTPLG